MQRLISDIRNEIENYPSRTSWERGVRSFAVDIFDKYIEQLKLNLWDDRVRIGKITEESMLNGAKNWNQYSRDGNYLIYNRDICRSLYNKKEQKRTKCGELPPNDHEDWLDVQGKALQQAAQIVMRIANRRDRDGQR